MSGIRRKTSQSFADPIELGRESLHSISKRIKKGAVDEAKESGKAFFEQLLGLDLKKGNAAPAETAQHTEAEQSNVVEIVSFLRKQDTHHAAERTPKAEAAMHYHQEIATTGERASRAETQQMQHTVEQIKVELSRLVATSQVLKMEFAEVSVEQTTHNVGQYHLNFFEWMLAVIRSAREKVEDSGAWLSTVKGKGTKRGYWGMFKKHGTTFGLSGERAVATQTG
jgi:uncharacterized protein DUF5660